MTMSATVSGGTSMRSRSSSLPQHDDGLRRRLPGSHRDEWKDAAADDEVQEQRRRRVVEVVGVVDDEQQLPAVGVVEDRLRERAEEVTSALGRATRRWQQARERAIGNGRRGAVGPHVRRRVATVGRNGLALEREPRLPHTRRPREQHAAGVAVHSADHATELTGPADERPRRGVQQTCP
jgi:hypothetical protein